MGFVVKVTARGLDGVHWIVVRNASNLGLAILVLSLDSQERFEFCRRF